MPEVKYTAINIGAYSARFNGRLGHFKRGVLLKLFGAVIKDTPVDTGRLRGNWTFEQTINGSPNPVSPEDKSGGVAIAKVTSEVEAKVDHKDGVTCLSNSMHYAYRIEYEGWSHTKAPEGMVRKNLIRIANILRRKNNEFLNG